MGIALILVIKYDQGLREEINRIWRMKELG